MRSVYPNAKTRPSSASPRTAGWRRRAGPAAAGDHAGVPIGPMSARHRSAPRRRPEWPSGSGMDNAARVREAIGRPARGGTCRAGCCRNARDEVTTVSGLIGEPGPAGLRSSLAAHSVTVGCCVEDCRRHPTWIDLPGSARYTMGSPYSRTRVTCVPVTFHAQRAAVCDRGRERARALWAPRTVSTRRLKASWWRHDSAVSGPATGPSGRDGLLFGTRAVPGDNESHRGDGGRCPAGPAGKGRE